MLYNYNFGKLENKNIIYAPQNALYEGTWYCPASDTQLKKLGYKKIVDTPYPTDGHSYESHWEEKPTQIKKVWEKLPDPKPLTPKEKRQEAYSSDPICPYEEGTYTVDFMNKLWAEYSAEGDKEKTKAIQKIISKAKADIREMYPDED